MGSRFKLASSKVIHQLFDNEVVIVNLETGSYYSLQDASAILWQGLMRGASVEEIIGKLVQKYPAHATMIESAARNVLNEMQREGLLAPTDAAPSSPIAPVIDETPATHTPNLTMQKFSDMQDLLLLDPIHEVDDAGWPIAKKE